MRSWIVVAVSCLLARGAWGAITWSAPLAGGSGDAGTDLDEDETAATVVQLVAASTDTAGASAITAYSVISVDGVAGSTLFAVGGSNSPADQVQCKANPGFDYETKKHHVVVVQAVDDGTTPVTSTASLTVYINDIDDNDSTWQSLCGWGSTDARQGDVFANIAVCDPDQNSAITYAITGGDDNPAFAVSGSAITKSATAFASSSKTSYVLTVEARGVAKTATGTLTITLGGTNECGCLSYSSGNSIGFGLFTLLGALILNKI